MVQSNEWIEIFIVSWLSIPGGVEKYFPGRPLGGYLTRQLTFLLNNYVYNEEGEPDEGDPGLLIPRYIASGRTAPNGKVYPEVSRKNEDDLVPVRSIVTKEKGKLYEITPDLFSKRFKTASFPNGSAVGASLGTSFTEATTQGVLGLKHGGHERVQDTTGNLYAPKDCEFREEGKFIILKVRGGELKYPRPSNLVTLGKDKFKEGEIVCAAYHTTSPIYNLNSTLKLLWAKGSNGVKYFEKDIVNLTDCYAYEDGTISYKENAKTGEIEVWIGSRRYSYSPESIYYFPDGSKIKKYQRFCSGVADMSRVASDLGGDINSIFQIFRRQFYALNSKSYQKSGLVSPGDMQEEIVELVFAGLINIGRNEKTNKIEQVDYLGTQRAIMNRKSFFTTLSYGWSSKVISRALKGELNLESDIMSQTVLGLLLNDKLDQ